MVRRSKEETAWDGDDEGQCSGASLRSRLRVSSFWRVRPVWRVVEMAPLPGNPSMNTPRSQYLNEKDSSVARRKEIP